MTNILIVEGSDCSGKTTLINQLSKLLNFQVTKGSSFELSQCTNEQLFEKFSEMTKLNETIFDRFIYSNLCYAPLYKDFAIITDEQRQEIESKIQDRAIVIYLEAELETLTQRLQLRGDDYVTVDRLSSIKEKYEEVMSETGLTTLRFNTTYQSTDEIVTAILYELRRF